MIFDDIKKDFCADFEIYVSKYLPQVDDWVDEKEMVYEADWDETMKLLEHDLIDISQIIDVLFEQESPHLDALAEPYCRDGEVWWDDEAVDYVNFTLTELIQEEFEKYEEKQLQIWKNRKK